MARTAFQAVDRGRAGALAPNPDDGTVPSSSASCRSSSPRAPAPRCASRFGTAVFFGHARRHRFRPDLHADLLCRWCGSSRLCQRLMRKRVPLRQNRSCRFSRALKSTKKRRLALGCRDLTSPQVVVVPAKVAQKSGVRVRCPKGNPRVEIGMRRGCLRALN